MISPVLVEDERPAAVVTMEELRLPKQNRRWKETKTIVGLGRRWGNFHDFNTKEVFSCTSGKTEF